MRSQKVFHEYYQILQVDMFSNIIKRDILMRNNYIRTYFEILVTYGAYDFIQCIDRGWGWQKYLPMKDDEDVSFFFFAADPIHLNPKLSVLNSTSLNLNKLMCVSSVIRKTCQIHIFYQWCVADSKPRTVNIM